MKREIKFRCWNNEQMLYEGWMGEVYYSKERIYSIGNFEESELMQFTGLTDKNGKEIYEGDILECYDLSFPFEGRKNIKGVVVYNDNSFCLKTDNMYNHLFVNAEVIKIIGDIYENSDLLS